jgi:hypothetical protein
MNIDTKHVEVRIQEVDEAELRSAQKLRTYVPLTSEASGDLLSPLSPAFSEDATGNDQNVTPIRSAHFLATLTENRLSSGTLELDLFPAAVLRNSPAVLLGTTTLQQLKIFSGKHPIATGADSQRRLYLLETGLSGKLTGTWTCEGVVTGDTVTFRLELPQAAVSRFQLITSREVVVTSTTGLVIAPAPDDTEYRWSILPTNTARLTFSCRTQRTLPAEVPMAIRALSGEHRLQAETLTSRWLISPPDDLDACRTLVAKVDNTVRISDVRMNDNRQLLWQAQPDGMHQLIRMQLPKDTAFSLITVTGESLINGSETWSLPIFAPIRWERSENQESGPLLFPVSRISLTVPGSIDVDGMTLHGIQERDVITSDDGEKIFQLTQYDSAATAQIHTSTGAPVISESLLTVLESSGQLTTAHCYVDVSSAQAPAYRLNWPVSAGWDVLSVRYAVSSRLLFFEFTSAAEGSAAQLSVVLPEVLEPQPQSHRVIEIILQRSEVDSRQLSRLPMAESSALNRDEQFLVVKKSFQQSQDAGHLSRIYRRLVPLPNPRERMTWLPTTVSIEGDLCYEIPEDFTEDNPTDTEDREQPLVNIPDTESVADSVVPFQSSGSTESVDSADISDRRRVIESHILHRMQRCDSGILDDVMAVASVGSDTRHSSLLLRVPDHVDPVAVVNGHRVILQRSAAGVSVPLPSGDTECRIVLTWSVIRPGTAGMMVPLELRGVFPDELPFKQNTHHLLLSPELKLSDAAADWITSSLHSGEFLTDDVSELMQETLSAEEQLQLKRIPELRTYMSQWNLAMSQRWSFRTLSGAGTDSSLIRIDLVSMQDRRLTQYLSMLCCFCLTIPWHEFWKRTRFYAAAAALALAVLHVLALPPVIDAVFTGCFWGFWGGLMFSLLRHYSLRIRRQTGMSPAVTGAVMVLAMLFDPDKAASQEQGIERPAGAERSATGIPSMVRDEVPDILVLKGGATPGRQFFVEESFLRNLQRRAADTTLSYPEAVVQSLHVSVTIHAEDSVEILLAMEVSAMNGSQDCVLRVPLRDSRLVDCQRDGQQVFPSSGPERSILIPIPSVQIIHPGSLADALADQDDTSRLPTTSNGPLVDWHSAHVECRLRPVISKESSGIRFSIPTLPSYRASVTVETPAGYARRVVLQSGTVMRDWVPDDGNRPIDNLHTVEGFDVRVYSGGAADTAVTAPQLSALTICELLSGQQLLTTTCLIRNWNPLNHRASMQIPDGYRVTGITSASLTDIAWNVQGSSAEIQLTGAQGRQKDDLLDLQVRMLAEVPMPALQHRVPSGALGRVDGCVKAGPHLIAVRTTPEFAVQQGQPENQHAIPYAELPEMFRGMLLRTDVVYPTAPDLPEVTFRLAPKEPESEVRVNQSVTCSDNWLDWKYDADVETSSLPLFRHRMTVDPAIEIRDVSVFAGEADRLDKWYRRGDTITILLKEGTSGSHRLTILGRQNLAQTDSEFRLACPHLQSVDILESSLTITDESSTGFLIEETGGTRPDRRLQENRMLLRSDPLRFQVVDEKDPIVMRRRRAAPRDGRIAVIRSGPQVTLAAQISNFPSDAESRRLAFAPDTVFLEPPVFAVDDHRLSTLEENREWILPPQDNSELPSVLTIVWTVPADSQTLVKPDGRSPGSSESDRSSVSVMTLPQFPFDVRWTESIAADSGVPATGDRIPEWLSECFTILDQGELYSDTRFQRAEIQQREGFAALMQPALPTKADSPEERESQITMVADTVVIGTPLESAVAETTFAVFTSKTPSEVVFQIPAETILLRIDTPGEVRRQTQGRSELRFGLTKPVTLLKMQWLTSKSIPSVFSTSFRVCPPCPIDCLVHHLLSFQSRVGGHVISLGNLQTLKDADVSERFSTLVTDELEKHRRTHPDTASAAADPVVAQLLSAQRLSRQRMLFNEDPASRIATQFIQFSPEQPTSPAVSQSGLASSRGPSLNRADHPTEVTISVRRLPSLLSVSPCIAAVLLALVSFLNYPATISSPSLLSPETAIPDDARATLGLTRVTDERSLSNGSSDGFLLSPTDQSSR